MTEIKTEAREVAEAVHQASVTAAKACAGSLCQGSTHTTQYVTEIKTEAREVG